MLQIILVLSLFIVLLRYHYHYYDYPYFYHCYHYSLLLSLLSSSLFVHNIIYMYGSYAGTCVKKNDFLET